MRTRELLILVHGTGSSEPGTKGDEKWWQPESAFSEELAGQLSQRTGDQGEQTAVYDIEAFKWSGANSEFHRRKAGKVLALRLEELERQRIPYHLIGHSHGGSVIWHALRAARTRDNVRHLMTWVTVGTPFLTFGDRGLFQKLLLLFMTLATFGIVLLVVGDLPIRYAGEYVRSYENSPLAALGGLLCLFVACAAALYSLGSFLLQIWIWARRHNKIKASYAAFLGERWLPILHPDDEPLNGLRASVVLPAERFIPRLEPSIGPNNVAAKGDKAARTILGYPQMALSSAYRYIFGPVYNLLLAPLLDQFLWETFKRVLQGNDVPGEYMLRCARAPDSLARYWIATPPKMLDTLTSRADAAASGTASAARRQLLHLGEGKGRLVAVANAISWREVIHTSYFNHGIGLAAFVADFISTSSRPLDETLTAAAFTSTVNHDTTIAQGAYLAAKPYHSKLLQTGTAVLVVGVCAGMTLLSAAIEAAWLRPYTNFFQTQNNAREVAAAGPAALRLMPQLGEILARWVLLDHTEQAIETALKLPDSVRYMGRNARLENLQKIAFAIGLKGSENDLSLLLNAQLCSRESTDSCLEILDKETVTAYLLVHAIAAGYIGGNNFDKVAGNRLKTSLRSASLDDFDREHIVDVLLSAGSYEYADELSGSDAEYCSGVKKWAEHHEGDVEYQRLSDRLAQCLTPSPDPDMDLASNLSKNYFAPLDVMLKKIAKRLPSEQRRICGSRIAFADIAMSRCLQDRDMIVPIEGNQQVSEPEFSKDRPTGEMIFEMGDWISRFSSVEIPRCGTLLEKRLSELNMCLFTDPTSKPEEEAAQHLEPLPENHEWTQTLWNAGSEEQKELCDNGGLTVAERFGEHISGLGEQLLGTKGDVQVELRRLAEIRTAFELKRYKEGQLNQDPWFQSTERRCGWAKLGLIWLKLGDVEEANRLYDMVLRTPQRWRDPDA